jgi:hypothetical protein
MWSSEPLRGPWRIAGGIAIFALIFALAILS